MEEKKEKTKDFYDTIAINWNSQYWARWNDYNSRIKKFARFDDNNTKLDVGIGTGELEECLSIKNVTGIDISAKMISECAKKFPTMKIYVQDAENLPFNDDSYDVVFCRNYLQNFDDPAKAIHEMIRVARKEVLAFESAVDERLVDIITEGIRVVEKHHPRFPSFQFLIDKFIGTAKRIEFESVSLQKPWLQKWCKAKGATKEQAQKILEIYQKAPGWFKDINMVTIDEEIPEITSRADYIMIRAMKHG